MVTRIKKILPNRKTLKTRKTRKSRVPVSLRSFRDEVSYGISKKKKSNKPKSFLEEETLKEWQYWVLIENAFPYTYAFKAHHMLIPRREIKVEQLSGDEKAELEIILRELSTVYDCHMTNFPSKQSRKYHYHIHMLIYKDHRLDMRI